MKRTALLVLGMQHSGTSSLAYALHGLGAGLPQDLIPVPDAPPDGTWESAQLARLNEQILQACDINGFRVDCAPLDALEAHSRGMLGKRAAAFLQCHCSDAPLLVLQQAGLARLLPFWLPVLRDADVDVRAVIMVRQPQAVMAALAREGTDSLAQMPECANLAWLGHLLEAERGTRACRRVFLTYDAWMGDSQAGIDKLTQTLQLRWQAPNDRAPKLRAGRPDKNGETRAKRILERWSDDAYSLIARDDAHVLPAFFDALRPDFDAVAALPRLVQQGCQASFDTQARRLFKTHQDALAQLQKERDQALATLEERHKLILELYARQQTACST